MAFMYLYLEYRTSKERPNIFGEGLYASIHNKDAWLGSEGSRNSQAPIATFQIAGFEGLPNIDEDALWEELLSRQPITEIAKRVARHMTADMLIKILRERIHEYEPSREGDCN